MIHQSLRLQGYAINPCFDFTNPISGSMLMKRAENLDFLAFPLIDQVLQWSEHFFKIGGTMGGFYEKSGSWFYDTPEDRIFDKRYTTIATELANVVKQFTNQAEKKATEERAKECEEIRKTELTIIEILKQKKVPTEQLAAIKQETTKLSMNVDTANRDREAKMKKLRTEENEKLSLLHSQTEKNGKLENDIKAFKAKESLLLKEKSKYEESAEKLKQEVSSLVISVVKQNAKKDEMNTKKFLNEAQEREYNALASNRDRYHKEAVKLTRAIAKLEGEVEVMRREKPRKEEDLRVLQMDNDKLELNLESARSKKEAADRDYANVLHDLNRNVNLHQVAKQEIAKLKNDLAKREGEKSDVLSLLDANRSVEINLTVLAAEKMRLCEKLRLAQQENHKQLEVLGSLTEYHAEVQHKLASVEQETKKATVLLKEKSADVEAIEIKLRQADREVAEMKRKLSNVFDYLNRVGLKEPMGESSRSYRYGLSCHAHCSVSDHPDLC